MCLELDTLLEIVMNGLLFLACANWATIPCFVDWDPNFDNSQRNSGQKHDSKRIKGVLRNSGQKHDSK